MLTGFIEWGYMQYLGLCTCCYYYIERSNQKMATLQGNRHVWNTAENSFPTFSPFINTVTTPIYQVVCKEHWTGRREDVCSSHGSALKPWARHPLPNPISLCLFPHLYAVHSIVTVELGGRELRLFRCAHTNRDVTTDRIVPPIPGTVQTTGSGWLILCNWYANYKPSLSAYGFKFSRLRRPQSERMRLWA